MSFLNLFSGPSVQNLEVKGDELFAAGMLGQAKQTYERALQKLSKKANLNSPDYLRIKEKISRTRNGLAKEHQQKAMDYLEGGYIDDARDMLSLAIEINADEQFNKILEQQIQEIEKRENLNIHRDSTGDLFYDFEGDHNENNDYHNINTSEDEEFLALCNTLPDNIGRAYNEYGPHFKTGYVALNQGNFQKAAIHLQQAMHDNPGDDTYISLELATVYLNLNRADEALVLLENFLPYHPDTLPAYQLLCEIYWDQEEFSRADALLDSIPENLAQSLAVVLLRGETLYRSGQYEQTKKFYENFLTTYGWYEAVARELAKTFESLGETDNARNVYKELIRNCNACHRAIDPLIKDKYAELSFDSGVYSSELLETYLFLARELPNNAARYFDRISHIYKAQGNSYEAARFRAFSERAKREMIND